ncbi:relaxase/mobilization nuclease domain-containing protein, partial [Brevundimonas sp.]|uniref:relaxase/mobilization nuclease domain-containing protein n=1 Tax=Brevundimonas sp. TaxID=1871086 RepID=UPI0025C246D3
MVSVIHQGDSFRRVLNYNENKVKEGVAVCLEAGYYTKEAANLSFAQKLDRLKKQAALRPNTKVNTVHISLNFDPSEHHSPDKLREIAAAYLDKIGFAEQPYLLYQHHDAGHPHVHILTTNIRPDGGRISLHNLGKNQSEQARREIEIDFSLIKAEDSARRKVYDLKPLSATVEYGKTQTKRAIAGVLDHVLKEYKFSSLSELNAILHQYNISAERGSEDSRVYKNQGLLYRIRTQDGSLKGVPIKASDFFTKPTIKKLETDFFVGKKEKASHSSQLKSAIELVLLKRSINSLEKFKAALQATGIHLATSTNKQGLIYGLTYV